MIFCASAQVSSVNAVSAGWPDQAAPSSRPLRICFSSMAHRTDPESPDSPRCGSTSLCQRFSGGTDDMWSPENSQRNLNMRDGAQVSWHFILFYNVSCQMTIQIVRSTVVDQNFLGFIMEILQPALKALIFQHIVSCWSISLKNNQTAWLRTHCDAVVDFISHVVCNQLNLLLCDVLHRSDNMRLALFRSWGTSALWGSADLERKNENNDPLIFKA